MGQMNELISSCCSAPKFGDWEICAECLEHTDFIEEDDDYEK